ncbi:MAG: hypothetical protein KC544_07475 [Gemmatimonadetes bacterium]|nr:hypothetical protein [Gemmatimonadota bacterium]
MFEPDLSRPLLCVEEVAALLRLDGRRAVYRLSGPGRPLHSARVDIGGHLRFKTAEVLQLAGITAPGEPLPTSGA